MIENNSVLAIIPARGGSKEVPRKNLRLFKNQTLLAHTIKSAKDSKYIDRVVVSSEDSEIVNAAKQAGADVPFIRPMKLAQDNTPGIEPVLHALEQLPHYRYVVLLQVTSPLRTTIDIDNCIEHCYQLNAPACVSITEVTDHPYWMFTVKENEQLTPLISTKIPTRRQDLPDVYTINGAIYIAKTDWLLHNKSFVASETVAFKMPKERSLDIDNEFDFVILDAVVNNKFSV